MSEERWKSMIEKAKRRVSLSISISQIHDILGRPNQWAIVGGVIRDAMIAPEGELLDAFRSFPDIDVAVSLRDDGDLLKRGLVPVKLSLERSGIDYHVNSFGGLKIATPEMGFVDVWGWRASSRERDAPRLWMRLLNTVDFGLNAVAYCWPEREIIFHEQWKQDYDSLRIERLMEYQGKRELFVIRAFALAAKMKVALMGRVRFGMRVKRDIAWLLEQAEDDNIVSAMEYLKQKLASQRWHIGVLNLLLRHVGSHQGAENSTILMELLRGMMAMFASGSVNSDGSGIE
jgi:hypothetical protein